MMRHIFATAGSESLEDGVVLRIDRQHRRARRGGAPHEQPAGTDQAFLVGERYRCAAFGGGECRLQTRRAGDRRHHPVGRTLGRLDNGVGSAARLDPGSGQRGFELAICIGIGNGREAGAKFARELGQRSGVAVRRHRLDVVARGLLTQQIDRARADRTGCPQKRDFARHRRQIRSGQRLLLLHWLYHTSKPRAGAAVP
jgi:hypothetical protein